MRYIVSTILLLLSGTTFSQLVSDTGRFAFCGSNRVLIAHIKEPGDTIPSIVWEWRADQATDLPEAYRRTYFNNIDECKPVHGNEDLLVTASTGGVALIHIKTKAVGFLTLLPQAHSAELLPGNRIVVASSTDAKGNSLQVFDARLNSRVLYRDSMYAAHGVVWDAARNQLYAVGGDELRIYRLANWQTDTPLLVKTASYTLPEKSGHDLQYMPGNNQLLFTTQHGVWVFDIATAAITPYKELANSVDVKSVSFSRTTHRLLFVQSEESWWAYHLRLLHPAVHLSYPSIHIYKARWFH